MQLKRTLPLTNDSLVVQLSDSQSRLNEFVRQTKVDALSHLDSAQELSLLRHSISDELGSLVNELSSSHGRAGSATLLEDIEKAHRILKELQTVRNYAAVIQRALELR